LKSTFAKMIKRFGNVFFTLSAHSFQLLPSATTQVHHHFHI
jgi:hypothetical protein